ncbi:MAG: efflux RND transporter permease subunit, partial [Clostridiales bacterium]|nr:efflux RND transporter permease subunit [Clostridiales bacterium]
MKTLAHGITKHNKLILIIMVVLAVVGAFLITKVNINSDMTKYLANDSQMKIGTDIMNEELESAETDQTIKVMFNGLSDAERLQMAEDLSYLPYVDSVDYEADSEDYNNDTYSLFVIHTEYDYDSAEERSIEKTLKKDFTDYDMVYENEDSSKVNLPMNMIAVALVIAFIILIIMSNSWIEPLLLVVTIGVAILINMGSNVILGSVSNITFSIAAILQIVLSMDYSIILMNRYRQEFARIGEKKSAMESALHMAFPSVASSGFTTVVGLLMLVFMRFKIGMDLGIVLAKGVLISMICTFTVLPGIILLMHNVIQKTDKRSIDIPLFRMSGGMYKARKIFIPLLCIVFVLVCVGQTQSKISYSFDMDDVITDIFPEDNSIVMLVS